MRCKVRNAAARRLRPANFTTYFCAAPKRKSLIQANATLIGDKFVKHVTEILDLVEIHDTDDDREVKAQGLPFRVTVKILGDYEDGLSVIQSADTLHAFNIRPSERLPLPGYVEFS